MSLPNRKFPELDHVEQEHMEFVTHMLQQQISSAQGKIPFSEYMNMALHAPEYGYYNSGCRKIGEGGDFITAPELGSLFGACVANQCNEALHQLSGGSILELGAGSGALCAQILERLSKVDCPLETYYILETSGDLRQRQQEFIRSTCVNADKVFWLDNLDDFSLHGIVIANEVFDALPVDRFEVGIEGFSFLDVEVIGSNFEWVKTFHKATNHGIDKIIDRYGLTEGYCSEYCPSASALLRTLSTILQCGYCLFVDYGYSGSEYYHPQRNDGTLRCHFKHLAHNDPLIFPGLQDITAHVDMTALAETAIASDLDLIGFIDQANFLVNAGLMDELLDLNLSVEAQMSLSNEIKRLTLPSQMGEVFKVLALGKSVEHGLSAFRNGNRIHSLQLQEA